MPAFFQRVAAARNLLKQAIASRSKDVPDQATMMKQAKAQANSNAIVAGMGGIDNIQQMSPEQRRQAALRSVQNFRQNAMTAGGPGSANMQATMQRLMADPNFMKLSAEEKDAAFRRALGAARETRRNSNQSVVRSERRTPSGTRLRKWPSGSEKSTANSLPEIRRSPLRPAAMTRSLARSAPRSSRFPLSSWANTDVTAIQSRLQHYCASKPPSTTPAPIGNCRNALLCTPNAWPDTRTWSTPTEFG